MEHRLSPGVSGYLEVFILIGIATGGAGLVLGGLSEYASTYQGPSLSISGASIRQGTNLAIETLTVYNSGSGPSSAFMISTSQAFASTSYCYSVLDPRTATQVSSTCPTLTADPREVPIASVLLPGEALLVELFIAGTAFSPGADPLVTVTASTGAQASEEVPVVPA